MTQLIIFDLDGTLADGTHREHHIVRLAGDDREKEWGEYFAKAGGDEPVAALRLPFQALTLAISRELYRANMQIEIWTGRVESTRTVTILWLQQHKFWGPFILQMREDSDRTQDDELKRSWLHAARARGDEVLLAFEDRSRVVKMWREEGVQCLQVREGDF